MGDDRDAKRLLDDAMLEEEKARLLALLLQEEALADISAQPLLPQVRTEDAPLSFSQQRLWFLDQFEPDSPQYIIPGAIRLSGQLDLAALERGINVVVQRHEMLRTIFVDDGGRPMQRVIPYHPITLLVDDLTDLP